MQKGLTLDVQLAPEGKVVERARGVELTCNQKAVEPKQHENGTDAPYSPFNSGCTIVVAGWARTCLKKVDMLLSGACPSSRRAHSRSSLSNSPSFTGYVGNKI